MRSLFATCLLSMGCIGFVACTGASSPAPIPTTEETATNLNEKKCPDGTSPVACFVEPCAVTDCPAHPEAECRDSYCGGCNADFFLDGKKLSQQECQKSECPDGSEMVNCFVEPCAVSKCPAHPEAECRDNYCGGCNADFYLDGKKLTAEQCR